MKKLWLSSALTLWATASLAADPAEGVWKSPTYEDGSFLMVTIAACGAKICGTISSVNNIDPDPTGKRLFWDMVSEGGGKYSGGKVWDPEEDRKYKGKLDLSGNTIKISGCLFGICEGEDFTRAK